MLRRYSHVTRTKVDDCFSEQFVNEGGTTALRPLVRRAFLCAKIELRKDR